MSTLATALQMNGMVTLLESAQGGQSGLVALVGMPGPRGPAGPAGAPGSAGAQTLTLDAATALSGHRVVVATPAGAAYADPGTLAHADAIVGITVGAALGGDPVTILASGELDESSWSWTPGLPLYAIPNGFLSHTPPASGWVQIIALAITQTRIVLTGRQAVYL